MVENKINEPGRVIPTAEYYRSMPLAPSTKDGKIIIIFKKTGEKFRKYPVDAREALMTGDYTTPELQQQVAPSSESLPQNPVDEKDMWLDEDGKLVNLTDDNSTKQGIIDALKANNQIVRTTDSKEALLIQWNALVDNQDKD